MRKDDRAVAVAPAPVMIAGPLVTREREKLAVGREHRGICLDDFVLRRRHPLPVVIGTRSEIEHAAVSSVEIKTVGPNLDEAIARELSEMCVHLAANFEGSMSAGRKRAGWCFILRQRTGRARSYGCLDLRRKVLMQTINYGIGRVPQIAVGIEKRRTVPQRHVVDFFPARFSVINDQAHTADRRGDGKSRIEIADCLKQPEAASAVDIEIVEAAID